MPILGDFATKYHQFAAELGVPMDDLYQALVDTAENTVRSKSLDSYKAQSSFASATGLVKRYERLVPFNKLLDITCSLVGRQNTAWKTFGYIPTDWDDPSGSTGLETREASRAFEVCTYPAPVACR